MRGGRGGCPLPHFLWVTWRVPGVALAAAEAAPALGGRRRRALPGRRARPGPARPLASQRGEPGPAPAAPGGEGKRRILAGSGGGGGGGVSCPGGWCLILHGVAGPALLGSGLHPDRGVCGGGGLILHRWEHLLPGVLRVEGVSSCPGGGIPCPERWGGRVGLILPGGGFLCPGLWRGTGRASSCPGRGNPLSGVLERDTHFILPSCGQSPARCGGVVWEGSAVGREGGGPVLPGDVLELPWDAEGRPALGGFILTKGSSRRRCCRGDTSSPRCREGPDPGCCWKG